MSDTPGLVQTPLVRTPSKQFEERHTRPGNGVFAQYPPDGRADVQFPMSVAFGKSSEASQYATLKGKEQMV